LEEEISDIGPGRPTFIALEKKETASTKSRRQGKGKETPSAFPQGEKKKNENKKIHRPILGEEKTKKVGFIGKGGNKLTSPSRKRGEKRAIFFGKVLDMEKKKAGTLGAMERREEKGI